MLVGFRIPSILQEKSTEKCWSVSKIWGKYPLRSITFSWMNGWMVGRSVGQLFFDHTSAQWNVDPSFAKGTFTPLGITVI